MERDESLSSNACFATTSVVSPISLLPFDVTINMELRGSGIYCLAIESIYGCSTGPLSLFPAVQDRRESKSKKEINLFMSVCAKISEVCLTGMIK
jgi:hypothetical protein